MPFDTLILLNKTLCGVRTRAKWNFATKATALGARVPQAELFVLLIKRLPHTGIYYVDLSRADN